MPARQKSLQIRFVESLLVVSLVVLVGHLSVNFWGRYRVQIELLKMKTSLHTLKDTVNQIGIAYNELHKELQELADVTESGNIIESIVPENYDDTKKHQSKVLAKKLLHDIHFRTMVDNSNLNGIPRTDSNKFTQTSLNETTSYNPAAFLEVNKKNKNVGNKSFHNKKLQHNVRMTPKKNTKNAEMVTKNSLKSMAANTDIDELNLIGTIRYDTNNYKHDNIHKCHKTENNCISKEFDPYFYARF